MFIQSIELKNTGPITDVILEFLKSDGTPLPTVLVGGNGSGKTILLSHLVNCLVLAKQIVYEDAEVEKDKVFRLRTSQYISAGKDYSFSRTNLEDGLHLIEWQLTRDKEVFEEELGYCPLNKSWAKIRGDRASTLDTDFTNRKKEVIKLFEGQCCLFFPDNRFEEPAWLNSENLIRRAKYTDLKRIAGYSNRNIICTSTLRQNRDWLLDLLFDRQAFEQKTAKLNSHPQVTVLAGFHGPSTTIYESVIKILRVVLETPGEIRLGIGTRHNRQISVMKDNEVWVPNLFQLSAGQVLLLNLFLSILRDADQSESPPESMDRVTGIVIVDEVDLHLHAAHQRKILPELISLFPNVQFIFTSHAPLFLIGMEEKFGPDGFQVVQMPEGGQIPTSDFSELGAAYEAFKETEKHRQEIASELGEQLKPAVFVEGDYDIQYIERAAELLGRTAVLKRIRMLDGGGFGNLDKIWKSYNNRLASALHNRVILLYDCDTNKGDKRIEQLHKRVIPSKPDNPIAKGIENLFPQRTIQKLEDASGKFIDLKEERTERIRGAILTIPSTKCINPDEKKNVCQWLCSNGTKEDFRGFELIFDLLDEILS